MLNEEIRRYSSIGNKEGLYFVYLHIQNGATSLNSLKQFAVHNPGHIDVVVDAVVLLLNELNIIDYDSMEDIIVLPLDCSFSKEIFFNELSKRIIQFILSENLISLETMSYDIVENCFYIQKKCISLHYACLRNILLTLGLFSNRTSTTFFVSPLFNQNVTSHIKKRRKFNLQELLLKLENQAKQGEAGEQFVLEYERKRLEGRFDIDNIEQISVIDVAAGYDIISFDSIDSCRLDRFIEVKTYQGKPHFHWSSNEMNIAKLRSKHYYIYLVAFDYMKEEGYQPIIIKDPIQYFDGNLDWELTIDGITYNKR